jgi:hypothetical protein
VACNSVLGRTGFAAQGARAISVDALQPSDTCAPDKAAL